MMDKDFDLLWKFEALRLAVLEQLDAQGYINTDKVFQRAKDIYNAGYEHSIDKWKTYWNKEEKPEYIDMERRQKEEAIKKGKKKPEKITSPIKTDKKGFKICGECKQLVPRGWKVHLYKENGSACNFRFEEEK